MTAQYDPVLREKYVAIVNRLTDENVDEATIDNVVLLLHFADFFGKDGYNKLLDRIEKWN